MNELTRADAWLDDVLDADLELAAAIDAARYPNGLPAAGPDPQRIFGELAPDDALEPFVVFQGQGGPTSGGVDAGTTDNGAIGTARVLTTCTVLVKAVATAAGYGLLEPIADRIDALLHGAPTVEVAALEAGGDSVIVAGCVRVSPVKYPEPVDGRQVRHLGGLYRLTMHRAP